MPKTQRPFRVRTFNTVPKSVSGIRTSSSSSAPSRSPSIISDSDTSTSTEDSAFPIQRIQHLPADDTDVLPEEQHPPQSISEGIAQSNDGGNHFPPDHFLAPPTPEQIRQRRKRKSRKLLYTFVRQKRKEEPPQKRLFVDPKVKSLYRETDKSKWKTLDCVEVPYKSMNKNLYRINSAEFRPVKIVKRVYKPTIQRRRRIHEEILEGIGIGGYVVRFGDGHEHCVYSNAFGRVDLRFPLTSWMYFYDDILGWRN